MNQALELLDPILNDELSSAREAFGKAVSQKVAEISSTGNRFSTAVLNILEALAKEEPRRRAAAILACSTKLSPSSMITLRLDALVSWAQDRLSREKADIEAVIANVDMGKIERHPAFLDEVAGSSAGRLVAELGTFWRAASSSELDVKAEAPDFVRKAKWIVTKGRRNWRWLAIGLLLLVALAVAPRLLPPKVASILGLEGEPSPTPAAASRTVTVWAQNWLTVNDPVPWMSSSDGTSATNREQFLNLLNSLDLGSSPTISSLRAKIVELIRSAPSRPEDPVYNVQVSPEIRADFQSLRRAIRDEAVAVGVTVNDGE